MLKKKTQYIYARHGSQELIQKFLAGGDVILN